MVWYINLWVGKQGKVSPSLYDWQWQWYGVEIGMVVTKEKGDNAMSTEKKKGKYGGRKNKTKRIEES